MAGLSLVLDVLVRGVVLLGFGIDSVLARCFLAMEKKKSSLMLCIGGTGKGWACSSLFLCAGRIGSRGRYVDRI